MKKDITYPPVLVQAKTVMLVFKPELQIQTCFDPLTPTRFPGREYNVIPVSSQLKMRCGAFKS